MKNLLARDIMARPVISAMMNASARDIALQISSGLSRSMPVTDGNREVVGMVTELDLLEQVHRGKELVRLTAADVMSRDPLTVDGETPLHEVLDIMIKNSILKLPVTEKGHLVGVISHCNILKVLIEPEFVMCL